MCSMTLDIIEHAKGVVEDDAYLLLDYSSKFEAI